MPSILSHKCPKISMRYPQHLPPLNEITIFDSFLFPHSDILRQYSTEDLSGVQTTYVLLAELCVRIQEKRYQDQNDDRENQGSWNVCDCITFLGKELKISNNRTSKLVSAFEEVQYGMTTSFKFSVV